MLYCGRQRRAALVTTVEGITYLDIVNKRVEAEARFDPHPLLHIASVQTFWVKVPLPAKAEATTKKARRTKAVFMMFFFFNHVELFKTREFVFSFIQMEMIVSFV